MGFFRQLFRRRPSDDDIHDELQYHIDRRTRFLEEEGTSPEDARDRARKQFGRMMHIHENIRRVHVSAFAETLGQDVRYAARSFLRTPALTASAILALALGVGSTTAVFSVVDRILFRTLPFADAERLVSVGMTAPILPGTFLLGTDYLEWRRAQQPFDAFTSWSGTSGCDLSEQNPLRLSCASVEHTFLPAFGVQPALGRNFTSDEDKAKAPKVALLSYSLWQSRFGGDASILDRTVSIDGQQVRVIGVLPPSFELPTLERPDIVIPQALPEEVQVRPNTGRPLQVFARLRRGVTATQAQSALEPLFEESMKWIPPAFVRDVHLKVESLRDYQVRDSRLASWTLLGSVIAVLWIACANVANLLLAKSASRHKELAVRSAIGAGRGRLVRQSLTESLLLSFAGGLSGILFAGALLRVFVRLAPAGIPRLFQAQIDMRVLSVSLIATCASGILFGIFPALQLPKPETLLGWRAIGTRRRRLSPILVAGQIAISLVLLTAATLLIRTLWKLEQVPLGFQTANVVTAEITLSAQRYPTAEKQNAFFAELESNVASRAGFDHVALADTAPPSAPGLLRLLANFEVEGHRFATAGTGGSVGERSVTPAYFTTLGIPILAGRGFEESDRKRTDGVAILSESLARTLFPFGAAVDQTVRLAPDAPLLTVIGVAGDVKNTGLTEQTMPEVYEVRKAGITPNPGLQRHGVLIVRSAMRPDAISGLIRTELARIDSGLPVAISTMQENTERLTDRPRFNAALLSLFGLMGLLLASIGLYGVMASLVAQRTAEIGVRMAVGATRSHIFRLVLRQAARWTAAGLGFGIAGSWLVSRFLRHLLFDIPEHDPVAFAVSILCLVVVVLMAALLPSRRAASVDPVIALRGDGGEWRR
jgi:putative ABC transport system permease protein